MNTNLTSRSLFLVFLMTMLILSEPFVTLAQGDSAEVQARHDAKNDVNEFAWVAGAFIGVASFWGTIELLNESSIDNTTDTSLRVLAMIVTFLIPGYAIFDSPTPPIERLVGKSPEYVNAYVDTYAKEAKRLRIVSSTAGCAVGCLGLIVYLLATEPLVTLQ